MLGIIAFILLIAPLIFQTVWGRKAIGEDIKMKFGQVCLLSLIFQIVFSIAGFSLFNYTFQRGLRENEVKCGMPLAAIILLVLFFTFLLLLVIVIQFFIKRRYDKFS